MNSPPASWPHYSFATALRAFIQEERGEISPVSYFLALLLALFFLFFALDLGIRKGKRLGVEYASFCAARAAAVLVPKGQERKGGADVEEGERREVRYAAAACLLAVADKGRFMPLSAMTFQALKNGNPTPFITGPFLSKYLELYVLPNVAVFFRDPGNPGNGQEKLHYDRGSPNLLVEIQYKDRSHVPFSPLNPKGGLGVFIQPSRTMIARAEAVMQVTK